MGNIRKHIQCLYKNSLSDEKIQLGVDLFSDKLKEKLIAGNKVRFLRHFESMEIIRVKKKVDFNKLNINSSFEKYELQIDHPNINNAYMKFIFSNATYAAIQKSVLETNIKYKYVN